MQHEKMTLAELEQAVKTEKQRLYAAREENAKRLARECPPRFEFECLAVVATRGSFATPSSWYVCCKETEDSYQRRKQAYTECDLAFLVSSPRTHGMCYYIIADSTVLMSTGGGSNILKTPVALTSEELQALQEACTIPERLKSPWLPR